MDSSSDSDDSQHSREKSPKASFNGAKIKKYSRSLTTCDICGKSSRFKYYNVQSCESCKQFFRRIVLKQKEFHCGLFRKCEPVKGEKCRGCRLDKCLRMGMDPGMICAQKSEKLIQFLKRLEQRRLQIFYPSNSAQKVQTNKKNNDVIEMENESPSNSEIDEGIGRFDSPDSAIKAIIHSHGIVKMEIKINSEKMKKKREEEIQQESALIPQRPPFLLDFSTGLGCLDYAVRMVNNHRRIWNSSTEIPNEYICKHENLADFLKDSKNLLAKADKFSTQKPEFWNRQRFIEMTEQFSFFFKENLQCVVVDMFLLIEVAKTMPFFPRLAPNDQIALLKHTFLPAMMFFNSFYSKEMGGNTWTRPNGTTTITQFIDSQRFGYDQKIRTMAIELLCKTVDIFKRADIELDEFALLICLLFTNTIDDDISKSATSLLYEESIQIMDILMRLLKRKYGNLEGPKRFAEAMNLLNAAYKFKYSNKRFCTYLEIFHAKGKEVDFFPKVQIPLWLTM